MDQLLILFFIKLPSNYPIAESGLKKIQVKFIGPSEQKIYSGPFETIELGFYLGLEPTKPKLGLWLP